jgi:GxxExxY protein
MVELIHEAETRAIIGAAMEVHNVLGCGFLEAVYHEALEHEFGDRGIPIVSQKELPVLYKGRRLNKVYVTDFVAFDKIIVEIKALDQLTSREQAQLMNYLKATGMEVGLLLNFGAEKLTWDRKVLTSLSSFYPKNPRHPRINQEPL